MKYNKHQYFNYTNHISYPRIESKEFHVSVGHLIYRKYQQVEQPCKYRQGYNQIQFNICPKLGQLPRSHAQQQRGDDDVWKHLEQITHEI